MAFVHGKEATMSIDATDISAQVDTTSLNRVKDLAEVTTFASTGDNKEHIDGLRGHEISIGGPWNATVDAVIYGTDDGSSVAFSYSPDGGTTTYAGNCFLSNYSFTSNASNRNEWSAGFSTTGAVTRT